MCDHYDKGVKVLMLSRIILSVIDLLCRPPDSLVQNGALSEEEYKDESLSTVISDFWKLRRGSQEDVLPSPRISPEPWGAVPELVVTWETDHKGENHGKEIHRQRWFINLLKT